MNPSLRYCQRCVMNSSISEVRFDENGHCQFCSDFLQKKTRRRQISEEEREHKLATLVEQIRSHKRGRYDCILGLSGGVDSSYALHLAKLQGLSPLVVHLDNGWNSEMAVDNMRRLLRSTSSDLHTHVIDWEDYRDLQRSFIRAHVIDIELLMDHAMLAILYRMAHKHGLKYILTGINTSTEGINFPRGWAHFKFDAKNILSIQKRFGTRRPRSYPYMRLWKYIYYRYIRKIELVSFLDYFPYNKNEAQEILQKTYGYRSYEKKHYENVFTRYFQGHILPQKFRVDKRIPHFSNLICTSQMGRDEAIEELQKSPYDNPAQLRLDHQFVLKKLKMTEAEFADYLAAPAVAHLAYENEYGQYRWLRKLLYNY